MSGITAIHTVCISNYSNQCFCVERQLRVYSLHKSRVSLQCALFFFSSYYPLIYPLISKEVNLSFCHRKGNVCLIMRKDSYLDQHFTRVTFEENGDTLKIIGQSYTALRAYPFSPGCFVLSVFTPHIDNGVVVA